jgi:serine protease Do
MLSPLRKYPSGVLLALLVLVFVAGVVVGTAGPWSGRGAVLASSAPAGQPAPVPTIGPTSPVPDFTAVATAAMPAVVNISSARIVRNSKGDPGPFFGDPFFPFFFGEEFLRQFRVPRERWEQSLGSGVLVKPEGILLTNNHVVEHATEVRVTLADKREFSATIVGTDPKTDLAVLRIAGGPFPVLPLADSERVQVAEPVLAIGNPFGLSQTVTQGIISAVGRANVGITDYEDFLQTDAAINPGNSGGALVNARGELIGINTAIFSQSGGYMGIGFAIPSNMARAVMDQILTTGRVSRGWLGASIQDLRPAMARSFGLAEAKGVLVGDVSPKSPAAGAGLQRGDIILRVNDRPVADSAHLRNLIAETPAGTAVTLTLFRDGKEQRIRVTMGEQPAERTASREGPAPAEPAHALGVAVIDPTPELLRRLDLPSGARGALVREVQPGSPAQEAGLRPGDLIQEVNRRPIRSAREFGETVRQQQGKDLVLLVNRGGNTAFVILERSGKG